MQSTTRLAKRLTELDRSAAWLARQVGVTQPTAWRWAAGQIEVPEAKRQAVADALDLDVAELSH